MQYKNSVTVALIVGDVDFAKHFTEKYKTKLVNIVQKHRTNSDEMYHYNKAQIAFYEKKYAEVERFLRFNETPHSILSLDAEILLLKAYFEQELIERRGMYLCTEQHTSSFAIRLAHFKQHIGREKDAQITMHTNFILIMEAIVQLYATYKIGWKIPENLTINLIKQHTPTVEERWLRKKLLF